jgi:cell wall-associated NlpC family hydrolase
MDAKKIVAAAGAALLGLVLIVVVIVAPASMDTDCGPVGGPSGSGSIMAAGSLVKPTASDTTTDTSGFGERWGSMHQGIDRAGPVGTPIYAFTDGRVAAAGTASGFGHWIVLDHEIAGQTYSTVYGHMFADGVLVEAGQHVSAGQEIGKIGNDGESTGAHLHFEVWEGARLPDGAGRAVDPAPWVERAVEPGAAAAASPTAPLPSAPGTGALNSAQLALAQQTVAIGEAMGVPEQGIVVALSTEGQESTYRMLASSNVPESMNYPHDGVGSDHLSVNQFQQQVTIWGTTEELMNPVTANLKFYTALLEIPGWESMAVTDAAQAVQGSATPDAYADDEPLARTLYAEFKGSRADLSAEDLAAIAAGGAGAATAVVDGGTAPGACPPPSGSGSGPQFQPGGPFGANVIAAASRWIGTPYAWGGGDQNGPTGGISDGGGAADAHGDTGKTGFDCSGLTLYAVFQASGGKILLPHYTGDTSNAGQLYDPRGQDIAFDDKQPGDLIYFGSGGNTHHVGIYTGTENGQDMLLNAPQSGQTVSVMPLSGWAGEDMYVRRFG